MYWNLFTQRSAFFDFNTYSTIFACVKEKFGPSAAIADFNETGLDLIGETLFDSALKFKTKI